MLLHLSVLVQQMPPASFISFSRLIEYDKLIDRLVEYFSAS